MLGQAATQPSTTPITVIVVLAKTVALPTASAGTQHCDSGRFHGVCFYLVSNGAML
jgi:hypothetical protein